MKNSDDIVLEKFNNVISVLIMNVVLKKHY